MKSVAAVSRGNFIALLELLVADGAFRAAHPLHLIGLHDLQLQLGGGQRGVGPSIYNPTPSGLPPDLWRQRVPFLVDGRNSKFGAREFPFMIKRILGPRLGILFPATDRQRCPKTLPETSEAKPDQQISPASTPLCSQARHALHDFCHGE